MIYATGSTSVSISVQIVDDAGLPVTGLTAATFPPVKYSLAGPSASVSVSLSDLALITSPWSSGGVKERELGFYRIDIPNAALASAGLLRIEGEASGKHLLAAEIQVGLAAVGAELLVDGVTKIESVNLNQMVGLYAAGAFDVRNVTENVGGSVQGNVEGNVAGSVFGDVQGKVLGGGAGTITAAGVWALDGTGAAIPTANQNADGLLARNIAGGSSTGRTVRQALAAQRNKVAFDVPVAGQFTVYAEDDSTPLWTGTYTATPGANPVTAIDPA